MLEGLINKLKDEVEEVAFRLRARWLTTAEVGQALHLAITCPRQRPVGSSLLVGTPEFLFSTRIGFHEPHPAAREASKFVTITWIDQDESGIYDPDGKRSPSPLPNSNRRREWYKYAEDGAPERAKTSTWQMGRFRGCQMIVTFEITTEHGIAWQRLVGVAHDNWPHPFTSTCPAQWTHQTPASRSSPLPKPTSSPPKPSKTPPSPSYPRTKLSQDQPLKRKADNTLSAAAERYQKRKADKALVTHIPTLRTRDAPGGS